MAKKRREILVVLLSQFKSKMFVCARAVANACQPIESTEDFFNCYYCFCGYCCCSSWWNYCYCCCTKFNILYDSISFLFGCVHLTTFSFQHVNKLIFIANLKRWTRHWMRFGVVGLHLDLRAFVIVTFGVCVLQRSRANTTQHYQINVRSCSRSHSLFSLHTRIIVLPISSAIQLRVNWNATKEKCAMRK